MDIIKTLDSQNTVLCVFFYAQNNHTTLAVGESGISLP